MPTTKVLLGLGVPAIITLLIIAFVVGLQSQIISQIQLAQVSSGLNGSVFNETLTGNGTLAHYADNNGYNAVDNGSSVLVFNSSGGAELLDGGRNFTLFGSGQFNITSPTNWPASAKFNVTYNYTYFAPSVAYNVSGQGQSSLSNFSAFQPAIGTIVAAVIIVSLLFVGFGYLFVKRNED